MIHFEKNPFSNLLKLTISPKNHFWTKELTLALLTALIVHIGSFFLFSIQTADSNDSPLMPPIWVAIDKFSHPLEIDLTEELPSYIAPPPSMPLPLFSSTLSSVESLIVLEKERRSFFQTKAFLRGLFPNELSVPSLSSHFKEDYAKITLRSDEKGSVFWFDWIKKPQDTTLYTSLENWIKALTLPTESAFVPQLIEVFFSND